jgi:hypothetical protein
MNSTFNTIIKSIQPDPALGLASLGSKIETISEGVEKYAANLSGLEYFIVFSEHSKINEVSFILDSELTLPITEEQLREPYCHYSFRDNVTEFTLMEPADDKFSIIIIKDNKFEFSQDGSCIEITPQGKKTPLSSLTTDYFCIRFK